MRRAVCSNLDLGRFGVFTDADDHGEDAGSGHDFDEGVDAKAKEGEGFILGAEVDGNQPFDQVVEDGEEGKVEGVEPVFICFGFCQGCHGIASFP